jgi:hypothetical protein
VDVLCRLAAAIELVSRKAAKNQDDLDKLLKFDPNKKIGLSVDAPPISADYDVTYDSKIGKRSCTVSFC